MERQAKALRDLSNTTSGPGRGGYLIRQHKEIIETPLSTPMEQKKTGPAVSHRSLGSSFDSRSRLSLTRPQPNANPVNHVLHPPRARRGVPSGNGTTQI